MVKTTERLKLPENKPVIQLRPTTDTYGYFKGWKSFQDEFGIRCQNLIAEGHPYILHRFHDTREAGSYLPNQPGDHMLIKPYSAKGGCDIILMDSKYSARFASLSQCFSDMMSLSLAQHFISWSKANARCYILFAGGGMFELWNGFTIANKRMRGERLTRDVDRRLFNTYSKAFDEMLFGDSI